MKILLLSLNSDPVSRQPSKYGGAGVSMRKLAENIEGAYIAGEESCFDGDLNDKCIPLDKASIDFVKNGYPLNVYSYGGLDNYDLIVYADPSIILKTNKPQLVWAVGAHEKINPNIKHLLTHNLKWQQPIIQNAETKVYEFVLGIDIPPFQRHEKTIDIFQCSNNYPAINSHIVAHWCVKNNIRGVFAGPIDPNYKQAFLNEIDYNYATYIGQIDEDQKIKLMKKARCYTNLVSTHQNGPQLSVKQAWSYGCVVIATPMGVMPEVIKNGVNGFVITGETEFLDAVRTYSYEIDQKDCYETSLTWSLEKMINSFKEVVNNILNGK